MKYMPLVIIIAICAIYYTEQNKLNLDKEYAKQGLEQCMQDSMINNKVIWVKNCAEYIKTVKGTK